MANLINASIEKILSGTTISKSDLMILTEIELPANSPSEFSQQESVFATRYYGGDTTNLYTWWTEVKGRAAEVAKGRRVSINQAFDSSYSKDQESSVRVISLEHLKNQAWDPRVC